jgi:hypothetical protein
MAGVWLIGDGQVDGAGSRYDIFTPVMKTQRPTLDDTHRKTFMSMPREGLGDEPGPEKLDTIHSGDAPKLGGFFWDQLFPTDHGRHPVPATPPDAD